MEIKEKIAVMQHYSNGGAVEYAPRHSPTDWKYVAEPSWNWNSYDYRIKVIKLNIDWESIDPKWNYCIAIDNEVYFTVEKPIFTTNIWSIQGDYRRVLGIFKIDPNLKSKDSLVSRNGD